MQISSKLIAAGCTASLFAAAAFAVSPRSHEWLERFDGDRNGLFSPAEIDGAAEQLFREVDADGNGQLTVTEARNLHARAGGGEPRMDGDTDNDGALSLTEFRAHVRQHIGVADANRDGQLSMSEIEAMHRRHGVGAH